MKQIMLQRIMLCCFLVLAIAIMPYILFEENTQVIHTEPEVIYKTEPVYIYPPPKIVEVPSKPIQLGPIQFGEGFKSGKFVVTAYSPYDDVNGINSDGDPSTTATGTTPGPGTIAVDPTVIPYGSTIIIMYPDGTIERGIAEDTGSAIKQNHIDVFRYKFKDAIKFKKEAVVVWYKEDN